LLLPRRWEPDRRIAALSCLVLVLSLWAILSQWFFLAQFRFPDAIIGFLAESGHPLWLIYGLVLSVLTASVALPLWAVARPGGGLKFVGGMIERLGLLATLYLFFDVVAAVVVLIRNL
jgi:hypothetical protein